ncbi:MAG: mechanosensitive ion channel [Candidatus Promineofilum sp.]|nr:mechanosensitive ion channel [Promineifilum sp.]
MSRRLLLVILLPLVALIALTALTVGLLQTAQVDELELIESVVGSGPLPAWLVTLYGYAELPLRLAFVVVVFFLAWLVTRISGRLAGWALRIARYETPARAPGPGAPPPSAQARRSQTVQLLLGSFINFVAFIVAFILAAGQFVSLVNLAVVSTIVANAFGFAARDYIGDFLNGISNIFENRFDVGDNVSIFRVGDTLEGTVERVTVRTLTIRTRAGELIVVPQGEVRILRNYSRGSFTGTHVVVLVAPGDLPQALAVLLALADEAAALLPDLLEPWKVVSHDGQLGAAAELHIHARARYGRGAELRLRIMTLVAERLAVAGVDLAG